MAGKEAMVKQEEGQLGAKCNWTIHQINNNHFLVENHTSIVSREDIYGWADLQLQMIVRQAKAAHPTGDVQEGSQLKVISILAKADRIVSLHDRTTEVYAILPAWPELIQSTAVTLMFSERPTTANTHTTAFLSF